MNTDIQAHFADIQAVIAQKLDTARRSVVAAVAWLTDPLLFESLIQAARRGCQVQIVALDDPANYRMAANFEQLQAAGGWVYWIPGANNSSAGPPLRYRFCVLDGETVITSSCHRTRRIEDTHSIVVRGHTTLIQGYRNAFARLLEKYELQPVLDAQQVMQRMEVMRELLRLEDFDAVVLQAVQLETARSLTGVATLLNLLEQRHWDAARRWIEELQEQGIRVMPCQGSELTELQLELQTLEIQVVALSNEQAELEWTLQQFAQSRHREVGEILENYLRLRLDYWQGRVEGSKTDEDRIAEAEAEAEYVGYQEARMMFAQTLLSPTLDAAQQSELRRLYREASLYCHPARVMDADRATAQALFTQLQQAYQQNDLDALRLHHRQLQESAAFADPAAVLTEQDQIRRQMTHLRLDVKRQLAIIQDLRTRTTYQALTGLDDRNAYFTFVRQRLGEECKCLRQLIEENKHGG